VLLHEQQRHPVLEDDFLVGRQFQAAGLGDGRPAIAIAARRLQSMWTVRVMSASYFLSAAGAASEQRGDGPVVGGEVLRATRCTSAFVTFAKSSAP